MPRTNYALHTDVLRKFDPTIQQSDLEANDFIGHNDQEIVVSRLEGVESKWDREATPMRPVRIASRDAPIIKSAKGKGFPVHSYLDHENIAPIDPSQGDMIERRTGRDSWTDITGREGSSWVADYRKGKLTIFTLPGRGNMPVLRNYRERFVRLTYRLGAGGDYAHAGQTELSASLSSGTASTVSVNDASRLPPSGGTMLLGGEEYVDVSSVDHTTDEITIAARGVRVSTDTDHESGTVVHYCPMDVREAIAAKSARELVIYDDYTDWIVEGSEAFDRRQKIEEWENEWKDTVSEYASGGGYR